ncbi:FecR family protein [Brevundimonas sp.]|jgi:transmembrane sensor|uniref:FecR family protein n=1 Tax=Brevundimonas sp. TaxID=1871086 RepID=UPI0037C0DCE3
MIQRLTALFDRRPQTAEAWLARLRRPRVGARDQAAFLEWLEQDDDHLRQYEAAKLGLAGLAPLAGAFHGDLARLRGRRPSDAGRRVLIAGGLATAAAVTAVVVWPGLKAHHVGVAPRLYASAPGRIVDVALEDGSRVTLDADSSIQVAFARDVRRVTLLRGAAYFDVAHNSDRPFQVSVADRQVIVTGTRFVTALRRDRAEVSLLEGRVVIGRHDAARSRAVEQAVALTPGHRAVFTPGAERLVLSRADVEADAAWRERRLVFHDASLAQVLDEVGRYVDTPMVLADPALGRVRVTAVLPLTGEAPLLERMQALLPISVERTADGRALVRAG